MGYTTAADMVEWLGEVEMIRLTASDGELDGVVDTDRVERAITSATARSDTYLRRLYALPLYTVPAEIEQAARVLVRYDLSFGEQREPSEQVRLARKETLEWLQMVADDQVRLDLPRSITAPAARVSDRPRQLQADGRDGGW